jgi:hypothetical protein
LSVRSARRQYQKKGDCGATTDQKVADEESQRKLGQDCADRHARRAQRGPDTIDMVMAVPYVLVPQDQLQAVFREIKEKREAAEQRRGAREGWCLGEASRFCWPATSFAGRSINSVFCFLTCLP